MVENVVEWCKPLLEQFQKTMQASDRIGYGARIGYVELSKEFDRIGTQHLGKMEKRKVTLADWDRIGLGSRDRSG